MGAQPGSSSALPGRVVVVVVVFTGVAASMVAPGAHGGDGRDVLIKHSLIGPEGASQVVLGVKNSPANAGDLSNGGSIPGSGRSPGGGHGTHSTVLAWKIPWTEEPGSYSSWHCKESDTTAVT